MAAYIRQTSGGFEVEIAPSEWRGQWQIAPSAGQRQSKLAADVHLRPAPGSNLIFSISCRKSRGTSVISGYQDFRYKSLYPSAREAQSGLRRTQDR